MTSTTITSHARQGFEAAIRQASGAERSATQAVYADWLDEHGYYRQAESMRLASSRSSVTELTLKVGWRTLPRGSWKYQDAGYIRRVECPADQTPDCRHRRHREVAATRKIAEGTGRTRLMMSLWVLDLEQDIIEAIGV